MTRSSTPICYRFPWVKANFFSFAMGKYLWDDQRCHKISAFRRELLLELSNLPDQKDKGDSYVGSCC